MRSLGSEHRKEIRGHSCSQTSLIFGVQHTQVRVVKPVARAAILRSLVTAIAGICKEALCVLFHNQGQSRPPLQMVITGYAKLHLSSNLGPYEVL